MKSSRDTQKNPDVPGPISGHAIGTFTTAYALVFIGVLTYSMFSPGAYNWGTHHLAFLPLVARALRFGNHGGGFTASGQR